MFIGAKTIENSQENDSLGTKIVEVTYTDGSKETFSKLMYDAIVSEESCDASTLREKRIYPVVANVLSILKEWGIKLSELQYLSTVLNTSLSENEKEAIKELWRPWIPNIADVDDVDLVAVDRVLKNKINE